MQGISKNTHTLLQVNFSGRSRIVSLNFGIAEPSIGKTLSKLKLIKVYLQKYTKLAIDISSTRFLEQIPLAPKLIFGLKNHSVFRIFFSGTWEFQIPKKFL